MMTDRSWNKEKGFLTSLLIMVQPQEDSASLDVSDISVSCQQYTGLYSKTEG